MAKMKSNTFELCDSDMNEELIIWQVLIENFTAYLY